MTKKTPKKSAPGKQSPKKPDTRKWYERHPPYNEEQGERVIEIVANGGNLYRKAKNGEDGLPTYEAIVAWRHVNEDFAQRYANARASRADARSDRIDDYVSQTVEGTLDAQVARVAIDAEKWQAGKERPAYYGDRQQVDHNAGGDLASFLAKIAANPKKVTDK